MLMHPCFPCSVSCSPVDEDSCCHFVVKKYHDCGEVGRATKEGHNFPSGVGRISSLS